MKNFFVACFILFSVFSASHCHGELTGAKQDFSTPVRWGEGSFQWSWARTILGIRKRGDEGMPKNEESDFGIMVVDEWVPRGDEPYIRTIVGRMVWPLGSITDKEVGKTVKFAGLFGWYGGGPGRSNDLYLSKEWCGFFLGNIPVQGLEGMQDFEFGSIKEKEWKKISIVYKIRKEDIGKDLRFLVQVQSRKEGSGFPVLATADWKFTVTP